ncbi:hypothetical protein OZK63_21170 [Streptomyces sp. UMAF16]|nr:hypothetical protein [Streptomyces sp. UMAF16]
MAQKHSNAPAQTAEQRVADLHELCRADYVGAASTRATSAGGARDQLALARAHAAESAGAR